MSKFYSFYQYNPGGYFDSTMPKVLIVEADSADEANGIAVENGVYFDGRASGVDCSCCGDRWYRVNESDGYNEPSEYGVPIVRIAFDKNNDNYDRGAARCSAQYNVIFKRGHPWSFKQITL